MGCGPHVQVRCVFACARASVYVHCVCMCVVLAVQRALWRAGAPERRWGYFVCVCVRVCMGGGARALRCGQVRSLREHGHLCVYVCPASRLLSPPSLTHLHALCPCCRIADLEGRTGTETEAVVHERGAVRQSREGERLLALLVKPASSAFLFVWASPCAFVYVLFVTSWVIFVCFFSFSSSCLFLQHRLLCSPWLAFVCFCSPFSACRVSCAAWPGCIRIRAPCSCTRLLVRSATVSAYHLRAMLVANL